MASSAILCVLNRMFPLQNNDGSYSLPKEELYFSQELNRNFAGIQANEAPVKCLIESAYDSDKDACEIIYLCSNKCREPTVPASALEGIKPFQGAPKTHISAEEFFIKRIAEYCYENDIPVPTFTPLPYVPSRPADSLSELNDRLNGIHRLLIDITGGRRDAVILELLTSRLLKMRSPKNIISNVVYASFDDRLIVNQISTFELIDLINAVNSFTNYGRADELCLYFEGNKYVSEETLDLCRRMETFSDALAVCQVNDIDVQVSEIQRAMRRVNATLNEKSRNFQLVADAINAIDNTCNSSSSPSIDKTLDAIRAANLPIDTNSESAEVLRGNLESARLSYTIVRGELLLHSLIPTIQSKFIPEIEDNDELVLEAIKWCVDHQMIQQALCIYREKISSCLLNLGFFNTTRHFDSLGQEGQRDIVADLAANCAIGSPDHRSHKTLYLRSSVLCDYNDYFSVNNEAVDQLHSIIAWYKYLHAARNKIMHADSENDSFPYRFSCIYLGKDPDGKIDAHELKADIKAALKCICEPCSCDYQKWSFAFKKARATGSTCQQASTPVVSYSTRTNNDICTVGSIAELKLLLLKFAGNEREVVFDDFNQWCDREEKKQLSKTALGLEKAKPFYRGLCEKYDKHFSWRKDGEVVKLKFQ